MNWILNQEHLCRAIIDYSNSESKKQLYKTDKRFREKIAIVKISIPRNANLMLYNDYAFILRAGKDIGYFHTRAICQGRRISIDFTKINDSLAQYFLTLYCKHWNTKLFDYMIKHQINKNNCQAMQDAGIPHYRSRLANRIVPEDDFETIPVYEKFHIYKDLSYAVYKDRDTHLLELLADIDPSLASTLNLLAELDKFRDVAMMDANCDWVEPHIKTYTHNYRVVL